jgi:hypothetical protein
MGQSGRMPPLTDCGDIEDTMASWQKRIERDIAIDDRAKGKADGAQPSALPQVI